MAVFVFNFRAIGIAKETIWMKPNIGVWSVRAATFEKAQEKADEYFRTNRQFRFEYTYAGKG